MLKIEQGLLSEVRDGEVSGRRGNPLPGINVLKGKLCQEPSSGKSSRTAQDPAGWSHHWDQDVGSMVQSCMFSIIRTSAKILDLFFICPFPQIKWKEEEGRSERE